MIYLPRKLKFTEDDLPRKLKCTNDDLPRKSSSQKMIYPEKSSHWRWSTQKINVHRRWSTQIFFGGAGVGGAGVRQKDDFVTKLISQFISCKYMFCEIFFPSFCATLKIWLSYILRIKKIKGVFFAIIKIKSCAKPLENLLTSPISV